MHSKSSTDPLHIYEAMPCLEATILDAYDSANPITGEDLDDGSLPSGSSELLTLNGSCGTKYYKLPRNIMRFCPNTQQDKILFHKAPLISLAIDPDNDRIFCKFWFSSVSAHG